MPCICPPSMRAISGFVSLLPWVTFHEVSICCAGLFWIRMNIASGRDHTIQSNRSVDFLLYVKSTRHREPGILLMKQAWLGPVKHWQLADLLEINIFKMFGFVSFKSHSIIAFRWQSLTPSTATLTSCMWTSRLKLISLIHMAGSPPAWIVPGCQGKSDSQSTKSDSFWFFMSLLWCEDQHICQSTYARSWSHQEFNWPTLAKTKALHLPRMQQIVSVQYFPP